MMVAHRQWIILAVFIVFLVSLPLTDAFSSFTITVPSGQSLCFFEKLNPTDRLDLSFQVSAGGSLDIDFNVMDPAGKMLRSLKSATTDTFGFDASEQGSYEYCFANKKTSKSEKIVTFIVRGPDEKSKLETKYKSNEVTHEPLQQGIRSLIDSVNVIRDEQSYLVAREFTHRQSKPSLFHSSYL